MNDFIVFFDHISRKVRDFSGGTVIGTEIQVLEHGVMNGQFEIISHVTVPFHLRAVCDKYHGTIYFLRSIKLVDYFHLFHTSNLLDPTLTTRNTLYSYIDYVNFYVFLTAHHSIDFIQITNLMHNSFTLQQYVCYIMILNMFRAIPCSSSGGQIISPQPLVSPLSVNGRTVCRLGADCSAVNTVLRLLMMDSKSVRNMQSSLPNKDEKQCIWLAFII